MGFKIIVESLPNKILKNIISSNGQRTNACKNSAHSTKERVRFLVFLQIQIELTNLSSDQKSAYVNRLLSVNSEITDLNNSILAIAIEAEFDDSKIEDLTSLNEDYDDKISLTTSLLRSETQVPEPATGVQVPHGPKLKQPQVSFPLFINKNGDNLQKFFLSF